MIELATPELVEHVVWLDVSHLPRKTIMTRLPRIYELMLEIQMLDITQEPMEIVPTAHDSMGG